MTDWDAIKIPALYVTVGILIGRAGQLFAGVLTEGGGGIADFLVLFVVWGVFLFVGSLIALRGLATVVETTMA